MLYFYLKENLIEGICFSFKDFVFGDQFFESSFVPGFRDTITAHPQLHKKFHVEDLVFEINFLNAFSIPCLCGSTTADPQPRNKFLVRIRYKLLYSSCHP